MCIGVVGCGWVLVRHAEWGGLGDDFNGWLCVFFNLTRMILAGVEVLGVFCEVKVLVLWVLYW